MMMPNVSPTRAGNALEAYVIPQIVPNAAPATRNARNWMILDEP